MTAVWGGLERLLQNRLHEDGPDHGNETGAEGEERTVNALTKGGDVAAHHCGVRLRCQGGRFRRWEVCHEGACSVETNRLAEGIAEVVTPRLGVVISRECSLVHLSSTGSGTPLAPAQMANPPAGWEVAHAGG